MSEFPAYPLDQTAAEIQLTRKISDTATDTLTHRFSRRATLAELLEREAQSITELEEVAPNEDSFSSDSDIANARLYDKLIASIKGYKIGAFTKADWIDATDDIKAKLPAAHKTAAIAGLYAWRCAVEADDSDGFNLDGDTYVIRQTIGDEDDPAYVVRYTLRQPTEAERREYDRTAGKASQVNGGKKRKIRFRTNLRADVALFDKLIQRIDGATIGGQTWGESEPGVFVAAIDPMAKRQVVNALLSSLSASLLD